MTLRHRFRRRLAAVLGGLLLAAPALAQPQAQPVPVAPVTPVAPTLVEVPTAKPVKPALWVVSDADTTIYLFGTIHALRPGVDWFNGPVARAFDQSTTLVTEISDPAGTEVAQTLLAKAMLPAGKTLRSMMNEADRTAYDAALTRAGLPPAVFDRFKPWYAAVALSSLPLLRSGFKLDQGVEVALSSKVKAAGKQQVALETVEFQLGLFDALPEANQVAYLKQVAANLDTITTEIDTLIEEWGKGDADGLARTMNADEDVAGLTEVLLTRRNKTWADWIKARLDQPGSVFVAVGAGHLAGPDSVQVQLAARGVATTRLQ